MNIIKSEIKKIGSSYDKYYQLSETSGVYHMVELVLEKNNLPCFATWDNQWSAHPPFIADDPDDDRYVSMTQRGTWLRYDVTPVIQVSIIGIQALELFQKANPLLAYLELFPIFTSSDPPAPTNDFVLTTQTIRDIKQKV